MYIPSEISKSIGDIMYDFDYIMFWQTQNCENMMRISGD